jgi:hypothetical protein
MSVASSSSAAAIFGRLIQTEKNDLSPELAQYILSIGFAEDDRNRVNELAAKARAGTLQAEEQRDLENFNLVGDLLAVWHSKARRSLKPKLASSHG